MPIDRQVEGQNMLHPMLEPDSATSRRDTCYNMDGP